MGRPAETCLLVVPGVFRSGFKHPEARQLLVGMRRVSDVEESEMMHSELAVLV